MLARRPDGKQRFSGKIPRTADVLTGEQCRPYKAFAKRE